MPRDMGENAIIHNDFKLDNIVLNEKKPLRILGILDWEMATLGNPLMDLGNSLAYWIEKSDPPDMERFALCPQTWKGP